MSPNGIDHGPHSIDLFYGLTLATPQQSGSKQSRSPRLAGTAGTVRRLWTISINGLPIATFSEEQPHQADRGRCSWALQKDQDREKLFEFGRYVATSPSTCRSEVLHSPEGKASGFCPSTRSTTTVRAIPQPRWHQDRLSVERDPDPRWPHGHPENYAQVIVERDLKTGRNTGECFPDSPTCRP